MSCHFWKHTASEIQKFQICSHSILAYHWNIFLYLETISKKKNSWRKFLSVAWRAGSSMVTTRRIIFHQLFSVYLEGLWNNKPFFGLFLNIHLIDMPFFETFFFILKRAKMNSRVPPCSRTVSIMTTILNIFSQDQFCVICFWQGSWRFFVFKNIRNWWYILWTTQ